MRMFIGWRLPTLVCLACVTGWAMDAPKPIVPTEGPVAPFRTVSRYASAHRIPITGYQPESDPTEIERYAVVLTTLIDGQDRKQWLVRLTVAPLRGKVPPTTAQTFYTTTGAQLTYGKTKPVDVMTTTWGPFGAGDERPAVKELSDTGIVDLELLSLGLYRSGAVVTRIVTEAARMRERGEVPPAGSLLMSTSPFGQEAIEQGKEFVRRYAITAEDERAFVGAFPALISFFEIAESLRGVDSIVGQMVNKTAVVWSYVRHRGFTPGVQIDFNSTKRIRPPAEFRTNLAYQVPFTLTGNDKPLLKGNVSVIPPRPYLLTTAGIYMLTAQSVANPARHIVVQVLSTGRSPASH